MENLESLLIFPTNQHESVQIIPNNLKIFNTAILRVDDDEVPTTFEYIIQPEVNIGQTSIESSKKNLSEQGFECFHCRQKIVGHNEYLEHLAAHRSSDLKCIKCGQIFKKQNSYFKHLLNHLEEKLFNCPICNAGFNYEDNFRIHMTYHAGNCLVCPICSLKFKRVASLRSHLAMHQVEEMYTCWECSSEFENPDDLRRHLIVHTKEVVVQNKTPVCKYCKKEFGSSSLLRQHISSHVEVRKLIGGRKRKHSTNKKYLEHECKACGKYFAKLSLLQRHVRTHTGERPFPCIICRSRFRDKTALKIHFLKHAGIKPFACTLCPAQFTQKCNLKVHVQKTHTAKIEGEKSFKCTICDCIFKRVSSLNAHMSKMHSNNEEITITSVINQLKDLQALSQNNSTKSNENKSTNESKSSGKEESSTLKVYSLKQKYVGSTKIYFCSFCNKEFKKPSDLIRHLRKHTKEKPYSCHCGNAFSLKSSLQSHMKTHSKTGGKACPKCFRMFYTAKALTAHLRKHEVSSLKKMSSDENLSILNIGNDISLKLDVIESTEKNDISRSSQTVHQIKNIPKFVCDICDKTFRLKCSLEKHRRKHTISIKRNDKKETAEVRGNSSINVSSSTFLETNQNQELQKFLANCSDFSGNQILTNIDPKSTLILDSGNNLSQPIILNIQTINLAPPGKITNVVLDPTETIDNNVVQQNLATEVLETSSQNNETAETVSDNALDTEVNQNVFCVSLTSNENAENCYSMHCLTCKQFLDVNDFNTHVCLKSILKRNNIGIEETAVKINAQSPDNNVQKCRKTLKRTFECVYCRKNFNTRGAYLKHVQCHHQKEKSGDGLHKCSFCNKSFKKPSDLSRHLRTHTGEKPFACEKCDKRFTLKSTLDGHYKTHDPVATKNFVCEVCNSFFSSKASRKVHMLVHTGAKPHKCSMCEQSFRTLAHKRCHEKSHTNYANRLKKKRKNNITNILATAAEMIVNDNSDLEQENVQFNSIHLEFPDNNDTSKLSESIQIDPVLLQQFQTSEVLLQDIETDFQFRTSDVNVNEDFGGEKIEFQNSRRGTEYETY